ncbi:MAG: hypothetical protein JWR18_1619 [Segetibacter sp.]|jgi:hypothetical protein|nr:hypothetical protein [Segetibacter sp.]
MKNSFFLLVALMFTLLAEAQPANCTLKPPLVTIHFGTGNITDINSVESYHYERVSDYCPRDGNYSYTSYTSGCFRNDWLTLSEDHTPGDANGNMMLINASHREGPFFSTTIKGLKSGTTYEFAAWMMNVCRITEKCPFPLLPTILVRLQTVTGKLVARFRTGELERRNTPQWTPYRAFFTTPAWREPLILTMIDNSPGGCGNDFALDDITFRECVKSITPATTPAKQSPIVKKNTVAPKPVVKKATPEPEKKQAEIVQVVKPTKDLRIVENTPVIKQRSSTLPAPPALTTRSSPLIRQMETEAGEIKIDLYDNGDIDGDTVTIFHNNALLVRSARLTQKPITFRITVDFEHPHHEIIMVANNLGSIPPNTSMMVVTAGSKRYEVFISSNEQKNAKVVLDLKK